MSNELKLAPSERVIYNNAEYVITRLVDFINVVALKCGTKTYVTLPISELKSINSLQDCDPPGTIKALPDANEDEWNKAKSRKNIIDPLLAIPRRPRTLVVAAAKEAGVCTATVYNWIRRFENGGMLSDLLDGERVGGRRKGRLASDLEMVIDITIREFHLKRRKSIRKTYEELEKRCKNAELAIPHINSLYRRVGWLTNYDKIASTKGKELAEQLCSPKPGTIIGADTLLSLVQIDHMYLDIEIVDDRDRLTIGRAWLTLAICVFSRMVVGLYVSLDPPSAHSAGMCIVNAILPKENWLHKLGIETEWPCWGKMVTIQMDNAREFRGKSLRRAFQEYGIDPLFRAVKKPRYGAHIERYLGTVAEELKSLPGATFSCPDERGCYDSSANAALTFTELEQYLVNFIAGDYHQRIHSELGEPPIARWGDGVFGTPQIPGRGLAPRIIDENRLRLDFMPFIERTIQSDGVQWEHIHYYDDILRHWYKVTNPNHPKESLTFRFHYDPRDVSVLFFYDPKEKHYFQIPYRDPSHPPMSKWERDTIRKKLRSEGNGILNEELIFATRKKNHAMVENAVKETKHLRRERQRNVIHQASEKPKPEVAPILTAVTSAPSIYTNIEPFEDIDA